jgi:hypothetical protein
MDAEGEAAKFCVATWQVTFYVLAAETGMISIQKVFLM